MRIYAAGPIGDYVNSEVGGLYADINSYWFKEIGITI